MHDGETLEGGHYTTIGNGVLCLTQIQPVFHSLSCLLRLLLFRFIVQQVQADGSRPFFVFDDSTTPRHVKDIQSYVAKSKFKREVYFLWFNKKVLCTCTLPTAASADVLCVLSVLQKPKKVRIDADLTSMEQLFSQSNSSSSISNTNSNPGAAAAAATTTTSAAAVEAAKTLSSLSALHM